jgi:hypothetical protein
MDVKKRILAVPLAVALALAPASPALAGPSKGDKSKGGKSQSSAPAKHPQAAAHGAGRKVR